MNWRQWSKYRIGKVTNWTDDRVPFYFINYRCKIWKKNFFKLSSELNLARRLRNLVCINSPMWQRFAKINWNNIFNFYRISTRNFRGMNLKIASLIKHAYKNNITSNWQVKVAYLFVKVISHTTLDGQICHGYSLSQKIAHKRIHIKFKCIRICKSLGWRENKWIYLLKVERMVAISNFSNFSLFSVIILYEWLKVYPWFRALLITSVTQLQVTW